MTRRRSLPLGLTLAAYALALLQRPGLDTADTKIGLHVDPARFLSGVASVWSSTEGLGHVQGGQYSGYLWPMGPFFALGHAAGLADWVTERLWLGTLLALAAWGAVSLVDELLDRRRGIAHAVAGVAYTLNPYVVVFASRTTVFLIAYAALPWLLIVARRGLRDPQGWWWPCAFGLVATSTGGGVNATVTAFVLLGPVLLCLYEGWLGGVPPRDVLAFGWRALLATVVASLWWIVPLLVQARYGLNFLQFTEQVGSIWASTSLSESLRLMGYWPTYLGVGFSDKLIPYFGNAGTMLFNPAVIAASLLVPGAAFASFRWTRRQRYVPFLLMTGMLALLLMSVGWPDGTPSRRAITFLYNRLTSLQFLRTTYKAGPLLALAVALLAGAGAAVAWRRLGARGPRWSRVAFASGATAVLVVNALPFFTGRAIELTWSAIPTAWRQAGRDLDRGPANSRAIILPGQAYAYYRWGGTVDPVLPSLTRRPVAGRNVPPFDDLHAADLLWTVDDLVQQQRLLPGQLGPLLDLMSARAVITATDDNTALSGAVAPAAAASELAGESGFARPARSYGPLRTFAPSPGSAAGPVRLPQVRRYDVPARGLVRVEPAGPAPIVDGSAEGLAELAALGELTPSRPLLYAGDLSLAALRAQALAGGPVYITDSNRRRVFVASRVRQDVGWTVPANEPFSKDAAVLDPFAAAGSAAQTVAVFAGARYVRAPYDPEIAEFPEHRPAAAFDGDPGTSWLADTTLDQSRQWIEVGLLAPRDVSYIDLLPDQSNPFVRLARVTVNGREFALRRGWTRLAVRLRGVSAIRIAIAKVDVHGSGTGTGVGIAEVRIPGVAVRELLRPPVLAERALRGADLRHTPLVYVFERTTAAAPLLRGPAPVRSAARGDRLQEEAALIREAQDPERGIARAIEPPAVRRWTISGLVTVAPGAPDFSLDVLAGTVASGTRFESSGRLQGLPGYRASSAFDRSAATAWVAPFAPGGSTWIAWSTARPRTLRRLVLVRSGLPVRFPSVVSVSGGGRSSGPLRVGSGGVVAVPGGMTARSFRLTVLAAAGSDRPAVAIAAVRGAGAPAVRAARADGAVRGRCGDLVASVGARRVALRLGGTLAIFDRGAPLPLRSCGRPVLVPAVAMDVVVAPRDVRPLLVQMRSSAPVPLAVAGAGVGGGSVVDPGKQSNGSYTGVRVHVRGPSWMVLGESYNRGWQASCDGRSLGAPHVIDAFANGWRIGSGCRSVAITFGPQRYVDVGFVLGGLGCLALLLVLLFGLRRHGARGPAAAEVAELPAPPPVRRWRGRDALAAGALAGAVVGFVFALRAGAVLGPAVGLILWRGVSTRSLLKAASGLLVVAVPLLYVAFPGSDQGGYDTGFPSQHLAAHWLTVAAITLLGLVLARELRRARDRS